MRRTPMILDCDPGHDDAVAIMMAGADPSIELLGLTISAGNQTLEKTGRNALNLVQYLNLDVPVCPGSPRPLIRELQIADDIHGESGLDGFTFPPLKRRFDERAAVDFIIDTLLAHPEPVTLVTTGPMTNVALAMRLRPEIIPNIRRIVLMGGSYGYGNVTPAAEFNIRVDPEAAHILFTSGVPLVMMGLDVTRQVLVREEIIERMESVGTSAARLFCDLMRAFNATQREVYSLPGGPLHDPVTIAYLIDPSLFTMQHVHCAIDLSHGESYGRTNCDMFDYLGRPRNVHVAKQIDAEGFFDLVEHTLEQY